MKVKGIIRDRSIQLLENISIAEGTEITIEITEASPINQDNQWKQLQKVIGMWKNDLEIDKIFNDIDKERPIRDVIRLMQSLSANEQEKIAFHLTGYIQDLQKEQKWGSFFSNSQNQLLDAEELTKQQFDESKANSEKFLEKIFIKIFIDILADLEEILIEFRQIYTKAYARKKRLKFTYDKYQNEIQMWEQREQFAINQGNENFARSSREWIKLFTYKVSALKVPIEKQTNYVENLKINLLTLETRISKLQTQKDTLFNRVNNAKERKHLQKTIGILNIDSAKEALDLMKKALLKLENIKNNINLEN